jgi:L-fuconolactonase
VRIDAHQHFWRYNDLEYGWITDDMAALRRDFLPDDVAAESDAAGFHGGIAVEARQTLEETAWLLELADRHDRILGVVGWFDLRSPQVTAQIERFAAHPKLCGVRHVVQDEADDAFVLRDDFLRGIAALARHDLAYDILVYPRQLPAACELVQRFPDQRFVLDHIAKPEIRQGRLGGWAEGVRRLAAHPNVWCKASGMVTEADWRNWSADTFRPYLDVVFGAFGPERVMIGSDWPVCTLAGSYAEVTRIVIDYVADLPADKQALVLGGNAARAYARAE